jgi:protein-disulfide isomerase
MRTAALPVVLGLAAPALSAACAPARAPEIAVGTTARAAPLPTIPFEADDPSWGSPKAPATIVYFSDFECPRCALMEIALDEVKDRFGEERVRIVFKHAPAAFHPHARMAATVAQGVFELGGARAFWAFHELAFTADDAPPPAPRDEAEGGDVDPIAGGVSLEWDTLAGWAARAGVREGELARGLNEGRWAAKVERDETLAKKLGVVDPPVLFVGGWRAPEDLKPCDLVRVVAGTLGVAVPPPSSGNDECQ